MKIYSAYKVRDNGILISKVAKLYLPKDGKVADITWGKGVFWKNIDITKYDFFKSDKITCPETPYDFTKRLPYKNKTFDVVVFDPPYAHNPGNMMVNDNYLNRETTKGMYHKDIINLYKKGMRQAYRILKPGGALWVKCKDEIETSCQKWSHIEIHDMAVNMGFYAKDLFILIQKTDPHIQHENQQHARKNHSYLWVFKKK